MLYKKEALVKHNIVCSKSYVYVCYAWTLLGDNTEGL